MARWSSWRMAALAAALVMTASAQAIRAPARRLQNLQNKPCGSTWLERLVLPQGFGRADFRPCCTAHDACYGTCGSDKAACDSQFQQCGLDSCNVYSGSGPGNTIARAVCRQFVDNGRQLLNTPLSTQAYSNAQASACGGGSAGAGAGAQAAVESQLPPPPPPPPAAQEVVSPVASAVPSTGQAASSEGTSEAQQAGATAAAKAEQAGDAASASSARALSVHVVAIAVATFTAIRSL